MTGDYSDLHRAFLGKRAALMLATIALAAILRSPVPAHADGPVAWQQWQRLPGVVDIVGPRADGKLVASARGSLYVVGPDGGITPFSVGNSYSSSQDDEPYMALAPALHVQSSNCDFTADDLFIL